MSYAGAPLLESGPSSIQVLEGDTARIECRVDAPPVPLTSVIWLRDGKKVIAYLHDFLSLL